MEYGEELDNVILRIRIYEQSGKEIIRIKNMVNALKHMQNQRDKLALAEKESTDIKKTLRRYSEMIEQLSEFRDQPKKFITMLYN